jgi:hypothetical protein
VKFRAPFLVLALSLASARAHAQQIDDRERSAARSLAEDGVAALQSGDANGAVDKLERAYQIVHLPTVGVWSARALVKAGRLVSAEERYVEVTRWTGTGDARQDQAKADAARERDELLPRLPTVTLGVDGQKTSDVTITLDGEPVLAALVGTAIPVDPKHHVAKATRGSETAVQEFDIAEGQKLTVSLKFGGAGATAAAPPAQAAPLAVSAPASNVEADHPSSSSWNTQKTIAVAVGGAGVIAGVVSAVFTANALSKKSDSETYCKGTRCTDPRGVTALDDAHSAGNVATVFGIAGVALVGAGVALFVTAPSGGSKVAIAPSYVVGGGSLVATGSF